MAQFIDKRNESAPSDDMAVIPKNPPPSEKTPRVGKGATANKKPAIRLVIERPSGEQDYLTI